MAILLLRAFFLALLGAVGYFYHPAELNAFPRLGPILGAVLMTTMGLVVIFAEWHVRRSSFKTIWGATLGTFFGVLIADVLILSIDLLRIDPITSKFLHIFFMIVLPYTGFIVGSKKAEWFDPVTLLTFFKERSAGRSYKILDTSVIIDGRIADICETGFIEGTLVVPQFVLKELQQVADSSDSQKRARGRRGLDILHKIQKMSDVMVQVSELDFPDVRDVDMKLIELGKQLDGKLVTNDFNLNKVAQLRGVKVLNINELANAMKPVVLPGEAMKVFILKEGKEPNQGVAYLDDGTMVVVDNAKRFIGKNLDIAVTSVLQTTAGKMIFGRFSEAEEDYRRRPAPAHHAEERVNSKGSSSG
ncbi:MAG: PIN domain-containing protein [Acidobacteriota bacterium]